MNKILFDFTIYQYSTKYHGGGEYGYRVLESLLDIVPLGTLGIIFIKGKRIDKKLLRKCQEKNVSIHPCVYINSIPALIKKFGYTVIYSALPVTSVWNSIKIPSNVKFIFTIHGLRNIELCGGDPLRLLYESKESSFEESMEEYLEEQESQNSTIKIKSQKFNDIFEVTPNREIIVVSEFTKHSIIKYFPQIKEDEISVLYSPAKRTALINNRQMETEVLERLCINSKGYGLIVSAGIWYKNGLRGALAFDQLFSATLDRIPPYYTVVILGVHDEEIYRRHLINQERFVIKNYVEESDLEILYKHAHLFLYPSLNEGFGYPPLEAMKYGTICACAANTSISEVCRDMVLYFNPLSIDEMQNKILQSFSRNIRMEIESRIEKLLPEIILRQENDLKKLIDIIRGADAHGR